MTLADIERFFEQWAPRWTAWERDNVGLQVGRRSKKIKKVLVALDVTAAVVREAIAGRFELIISHHPLLFRPPSSISDSDTIGRLVLLLAEKKIAVYSAHTNLDSAAGGVSFALAQGLGVVKPRFLLPLSNTMVKIAVFVPEPHVDAVMRSMSESGAGVIGEYRSCSFRLKGTGTFRGSEHSNPRIGKPLNLEKAEEVRLEMVMPRARVDSVVRAMKLAHPYEEVAYDIYPLENGNPNFGMGAIGDLPRAVSVESFLRRLKRSLGVHTVRHTGKLSQNVRRIAVCGGSGSELLEEAIRSEADIFVTADVRYHAYHAATDRIVLVDAGHYETERIVLQSIADRLRSWAASSGKALEIIVTKQSTNPVHSF